MRTFSAIDTSSVSNRKMIRRRLDRVEREVLPGRVDGGRRARVAEVESPDGEVGRRPLAVSESFPVSHSSADDVSNETVERKRGRPEAGWSARSELPSLSVSHRPISDVDNPRVVRVSHQAPSLVLPLIAASRTSDRSNAVIPTAYQVKLPAWMRASLTVRFEPPRDTPRIRHRYRS